MFDKFIYLSMLICFFSLEQIVLILLKLILIISKKSIIFLLLYLDINVKELSMSFIDKELCIKYDFR